MVRPCLMYLFICTLCFCSCSSEKTETALDPSLAETLGTERSNQIVETAPELPNSARKNSKITVSKETTRIVTPLTNNGNVDYLLALNTMASEGVTSRNNAAVPFLQALGPTVIREDIREQFFGMIKMPIPPLDGEYFITLREYVENVEDQKSETEEKIERIRLLAKRAINSPWEPTEIPEISDWLQRNKLPLELIILATTRPRFYLPIVDPSEWNSILGSMAVGIKSEYFQNVGYALGASAMRDLQNGDLDSAHKRLLACHRLAYLFGQSPSTLAGLISYGVDTVAYNGDLRLLNDPRLTNETMQNILSGIRDLPPIHSLAHRIDIYERFFLLDALCLLSREGIQGLQELDGTSSSTLWDSLWLSFAENIFNRIPVWNRVLEQTNVWFDRAVAFTQEPNIAKRNRGWIEFNSTLQKLRDRGASKKSLDEWLQENKIDQETATVQFLVETQIPRNLEPCTKAFISQVLAQTQNRTMLKLVSLITYYRIKNNQIPANLTQLVPDYIKKLPKDEFTGSYFIYNNTSEGYTLYSLGPNGKDDGGRDRRSNPIGDDVVIRMFHPEH